MTQVNLGPPLSASLCYRRKTQQQPPLWHRRREDASWSSLRNYSLKCNGRFTCLLWDNHKQQEQARKALEDALGGKKSELDKWDKEIRKREEEAAAGGGGGGGGGGGWFRWWSNDDHFWQEAQQASLAVLGIILVYLIIAKGEVMLAVILNPLLFALRGTRNAFAFLATHMSGKGEFGKVTTGDTNYDSSAKSRVLRKWGSDQ